MPRKGIREAAEFPQVDGDKEAIAGYESNMTMDDMPVDWVEQVLSFLPITDVYKCKSVCKAWHVAADRVLNDWETLVLKEGRPWAVKAGKNQIFLHNDAQTWIKRLKQLVRLKEIFYFPGYFESELPAFVDDIVHRNATTLTLLHMRSEQLPFNPKRERVVFRNLRDLECSLMNIDQVASCPRLVKLKTCTSVKVLQKLRAETLTSLRIDGLEFEHGSPIEIERMVAALSRFTRLKNLILVQGFRYFPAGQWTEVHDLALRKLFTNMKELEEVEITFPEDSVLCVDAAIETLVQSPAVKSIVMNYARMTDASLRSLSRLTGLQRLVIRSYRRQSDITTEGVMSLLRGGSRNVLQELDLIMSLSPDLTQIRAEVELMREETGRTFHLEAFGPALFSPTMSYTLRICFMAAHLSST